MHKNLNEILGSLPSETKVFILIFIFYFSQLVDPAIIFK